MESTDMPILGAVASDLALASLSLARRFFAGAMLWCWSPRWPEHANHVAVEFVHPVIVGKRALPAEALDLPDPVSALRALASAGDVLLVLSTADERDVAALMRRARAWGVATFWVGTGPRPPAGEADHVLWIDEQDDRATHTGELVLLYHLLWELTHVCYEHPGLLELTDDTCIGEVCVTCADEAHVGEVEQLAAGTAATVRTATGREDIDTTLVGPVARGDLLLIHAGSAIQVLEEEPSR